MKNLFYLLLVLFLSSCSYKVSRTGYKIDKSANPADCDIAIQKNAVITESMQKIGEIRLQDTGFSVKCSEAAAIKLLKKEGCALNADLINIVQEKRLDIVSSCYRCTAEFYRVTADSTLKTGSRYSADQIQLYAHADKKPDAGFFIISILTAVMEGVILGLLRY